MRQKSEPGNQGIVLVRNQFGNWSVPQFLSEQVPPNAADFEIRARAAITSGEGRFRQRSITVKADRDRTVLENAQDIAIVIGGPLAYERRCCFEGLQSRDIDYAHDMAAAIRGGLASEACSGRSKAAISRAVCVP